MAPPNFGVIPKVGDRYNREEFPSRLSYLYPNLHEATPEKNVDQNNISIFSVSDPYLSDGRFWGMVFNPYAQYQQLSPLLPSHLSLLKGETMGDDLIAMLTEARKAALAIQSTLPVASEAAEYWYAGLRETLRKFLADSEGWLRQLEGADKIGRQVLSNWVARVEELRRQIRATSSYPALQSVEGGLPTILNALVRIGDHLRRVASPTHGVPSLVIPTAGASLPLVVEGVRRSVPSAGRVLRGSVHRLAAVSPNPIVKAVAIGVALLGALFGVLLLAFRR